LYRQNSLKFRLILLVATVILIGLGLHYWHLYSSFSSSLKSLYGVKLDVQQDEVIYRLGVPEDVIGKAEFNSFYGDFVSRVYTVDPGTDTVNALPKGKSYKDFSEWTYSTETGSRLSIEFDSSRGIKALTWYHDECDGAAWPSVANIKCGDGEEKVLELGRPTRIKLNGVSKSISYADIGVKYTLSKGKVYMVEINKAKSGKMAIFKRFLSIQF